jgi:YggT family protein
VHALITLGLYLTSILEQVLTIYFWIVIVSALLSWVSPDPYNPIVRAIYSITEPVFDLIREHLPVIFGGIDFSPLVVIFAIGLLQGWLIPEIQHVLIFGTT